MKETYYALILGASSGFGKAISMTLAKDGVNIIGVHLDRASTMPDVEKLIEDIKATGSEAHFFNINAADPHKREDVINRIQDIFKSSHNPTIKILVHSLAFGTLRKFIDSEKPGEMMNQKQMEMTVDVMAHSLVYWTQDIIKKDLMKPGGKIYAMTSSGGSRVIEFYGAVSAAKACLESHVRQLALELGHKEVAVNALLAGVTDTPALRKIPKNEELINMALMRNPQGRLTSPNDIADFILDNYKRNSHWMTGCVIHIDGGETISGF